VQGCTNAVLVVVVAGCKGACPTFSQLSTGYNVNNSDNKVWLRVKPEHNEVLA